MLLKATLLTLESRIMEYTRLIFFGKIFRPTCLIRDYTFIKKHKFSKNLVIKIGFYTNPYTFIRMLSGLHIYKFYEMLRPLR